MHELEKTKWNKKISVILIQDKQVSQQTNK